MQVDVRQQRGANRPLWDPKFRPLKEAMLHQSCFEEASDEFEESLVSNTFCQTLQQNVMLDIVKRSHNSIPYSTTQIKRTGQRLKSVIPAIPSLGVVSR